MSLLEFFYPTTRLGYCDGDGGGADSGVGSVYIFLLFIKKLGETKIHHYL